MIFLVIQFALLIASYVLFVQILIKYKISKIIPLLILLIPISNSIFGFSNTIRDSIKGEIVLSAIDDGVLASKSIVIREKNNKYFIYYDASAAGFGEVMKGSVEILNKNTLRFQLHDNDYSEELLFDKTRNIFKEKSNGYSYRVLSNKIFKE